MASPKNYTNCPLCGLQINDTQNRLIREYCGHSKCRLCLLNEINGCGECNKINAQQKIHTKPVGKFPEILSDEESSSDKLQIDTDSDLSLSENEQTNNIDLKQVNSGSLNKSENANTLTVTERNQEENNKYTKINKKKIITKSLHILTKMTDNGIFYECTKCNKTFTSKCNRNYHLFCGEKEKPLKCDKCDKTFVSKFHLNYHLETHIENILYNCNVCDKQFLRKNSLRKHSKKHGEHNFKCTQCGAKFPTKSNLKLHENKHKDVLPFKCDQCDRGFITKSNLRNHLVIHSGQFNFICDACGKKFPRKNALKLHALVHSNVRPYECKICLKNFADQRIYDRHLNVHTENNKFKCPLCDIICGRKDNFRRHLRNLHPLENHEKLLKQYTEQTAGKKVISKSLMSETLAHNVMQEIETEPKENQLNVIVSHETFFKLKTVVDGPNTVNVIQSIGNVKPMNISSSIIDKKPSLFQDAVVEEDNDNVKQMKNKNFHEADTNNTKIQALTIEYDAGSTSFLKRSFNDIDNCGQILIPTEKEMQFNTLIPSTSSLVNHFVDNNTQTSINLLCNNNYKRNLNINKSKKFFDPIAIYRKILLPSNEDDEDENDANNEKETVVQIHSETPPVINKESNPAFRKPISCDFSEIHWRKRTSQYFREN